ncbi:hypothetical protein E4T56_gene16109 [Termitomyces sp. T112]|nr:hypothetical protein E4T56_gene16109 [Termitomyces sp. T112]
MDATIDTSNNSTQDTTKSTERRRPPRHRQRNINRPTNPSTGSREDGAHTRQQRSSRLSRGDADGQKRLSPSSSRPGTEGSQTRDHRPTLAPKSTKSRNNGTSASETTKDEDIGSAPPHPSSGAPRRGAKFGASLTDSQPVSASKPRNRYRRNAVPTEPIGEDLTSRLIHHLRTPPYPDCPICFNTIHPAQPTWSCSPSIPVIRSPEDEGQEQQYCWTTFHVKCIGEWASKNVKAVAEAWRARGELDKKGDWRCPGCQAKREVVPSGYWCFCNSTSEPKPPRLATPHSCAGPCSRVLVHPAR